MAEEVSLKDVCDSVDYGLTTSATIDGGPKFLRITDIESTHIDWKTVPHCHVGDKNANKYALKTGDVVVARTGASTGRSQWVEVSEPAVFASYLVRFRAGARIDSRYLGYVLASDSWHQYVSSVAHGKSAQPNMSASAMADFRFPLPDEADQRVVADVLGAIDDKIAVNDRLLAMTDELCASEVRLATATSSNSAVLRNLAELAYGKALPAARRTPGDVVVFGSGGPTGFHDAALVTGPGIVVGRKGTVGAVYWADGPHFPIDTVYFVKPSGKVSPEVLYYLLRSLGLAELNSDSAVPGLNRGEAYAQRLRVPNAMDAADLARSLQSRFGWMRAVRVETTRLAETRDELLPLLMSGKVRVKDAEKIAEEIV